MEKQKTFDQTSLYKELKAQNSTQEDVAVLAEVEAKHDEVQNQMDDMERALAALDELQPKFKLQLPTIRMPSKGADVK
eukprot:3423604-Prymnesium_polylepis.1